MQLNVFEPRYLLMMERRLRWIQGSAECRGTEPKDGYLGALPLRAATQAQLRHAPAASARRLKRASVMRKTRLSRHDPAAARRRRSALWHHGRDRALRSRAGWAIPRRREGTSPRPADLGGGDRAERVAKVSSRQRMVGISHDSTVAVRRPSQAHSVNRSTATAARRWRGRATRRPRTRGRAQRRRWLLRCTRGSWCRGQLHGPLVGLDGHLVPLIFWIGDGATRAAGRVDGRGASGRPNLCQPRPISDNLA